MNLSYWHQPQKQQAESQKQVEFKWNI